jgi:hypothetical protein
VQWRAVVNIIKKTLVPLNIWNYLTSRVIISFLILLFQKIISVLQVEAFWVVTRYGVVAGYQCFTSFHPKDGGSMDL